MILSQPQQRMALPSQSSGIASEVLCSAISSIVKHMYLVKWFGSFLSKLSNKSHITLVSMAAQIKPSDEALISTPCSC